MTFLQRLLKDLANVFILFKYVSSSIFSARSLVMCIYSFAVINSDSLTQFGELFISSVFFKGEMLGGVPERRGLAILILQDPFNGVAVDYLWFENS